MGGGVLEVLENFLEELLHHVAVACLVGMISGFFGRRGGTSDGGRLRGVMGEPVANVGETDGMSELGVEQCHGLTPRAGGERLLADAMLTGGLRDEVLGMSSQSRLNTMTSRLAGCPFSSKLILVGTNRQRA